MFLDKHEHCEFGTPCWWSEILYPVVSLGQLCDLKYQSKLISPVQHYAEKAQMENVFIPSLKF